MDERRRQALRSGLDALQVAADDAALDKLLGYLELLGRWNRAYNLTAVRDAADMLTHHLLDCLAVLPALDRRVGAAPGLRVLDVGSGAGLPGIVLAAMRPAWSVDCVDAVAKKAAFIRQAVGELGLPNMRVHHARVEQLRVAPHDLIVSRAFASLRDFVALTRPHLDAHGSWLAMKGRRPDAEIAELPATVDVFHVEQITVPGLPAQRCLVWIRPASG
jgi:16S rRNA (guanine527-N7)-methyltransferase